jgi:hypothetical protein
MTTTQMSAAETMHALLNAGAAFDYGADRERLRLREHADREGQWPGGGRGVRGVLEPVFSPPAGRPRMG